MLKYVSIKSGLLAKSLLWRLINKAFAGKLNLITCPDLLPKTDGKISV